MKEKQQPAINLKGAEFIISLQLRGTCPIPLFQNDNHHPHTSLARRFSTEAEYPPQDSPPSDHSLEPSPSDQKQDASPIDPSLRTTTAGFIEGIPHMQIDSSYFGVIIFRSFPEYSKFATVRCTSQTEAIYYLRRTKAPARMVRF
ncbi:uncharacterized protein LOC126593907 isoform X2 [Malus sylvestris]|uniref:uncharacterized protein LOC126593907 isoform X2 n=1 Tax=Malus sylvestris TaxID=3752 RepID=UPI0021ABB83F|nr:uncharacterized protein LOC126593907 isoform X2 [Malus sylvestris]